jgi:hypothetical protein
VKLGCVKQALLRACVVLLREGGREAGREGGREGGREEDTLLAKAGRVTIK